MAVNVKTASFHKEEHALNPGILCYTGGYFSLQVWGTQRVSELPRVVKAGEAREKLTERQ